jgi:hypothetical protein
MLRAGTFDFGGIQLLEFMRDHILAYTEDPDKEIRQAAVLAACRVLERHAATAISAAAVTGGGRAAQLASQGARLSSSRAGGRSLRGHPPERTATGFALASYLFVKRQRRQMNATVTSLKRGRKGPYTWTAVCAWS